MKKAFTFAELMISLVVISVITAILYPTIADLGINENKALFKSAYRSMSLALAEVMNDPPSAGDREGCVPNNLCERMRDKMNVTTETQCLNNKLVTTNGMRWYIPNNTGCNIDNCRTNCQFIIAVDVASSNNNLGTLTGSLNAGSVGDFHDAKASISHHINNFQTVFSYGATGDMIRSSGSPLNKQQDTFVFAISGDGRILSVDNGAAAYLSDEE